MNLPPAHLQQPLASLVAPVGGLGWTAELELEYAVALRAGEQVTVPTLRRHKGPLRAQRHHYPDGAGACQQLVIHPPGGIVGGDELHIRVRAHPGAEVLLTAPGAAKWYRSAGPRALQRVILRADAGARLSWLPQPSIVFDGANVETETIIDVAADATLLFWDVMALGRPLARPEPRPWVTGAIRAAVTVALDGRPVYEDVGAFTAGDRFTRSALGLAGHTVFGTLLMVGTGLAPGLVAARAVPTPTSIRAAVTVRDGVLAVRALGGCSDMVFQYFSSVWSVLAGLGASGAVTRPRIWQT